MSTTVVESMTVFFVYKSKLHYLVTVRETQLMLLPKNQKAFVLAQICSFLTKTCTASLT